jgi:16S rRNA (adenine1518-N6/adenine1519-N6)-dimethyltransferase
MNDIKNLFKEFSYRPRKSQGQNFLTDASILDRIEQAVQCPPEDILIEVGGGYGAFTERLVKKGRLLTVVEPDHKLFAMLERKFGKTQGMALVKADILKLDLASFAPPLPGQITLVGNIPYYLTTSLITRLLTRFHSMVRVVFLMVQKEVADRLTAKPGTKAYGALTLCVQYYSSPRKILEVPARCFKPRPKVDSAFISLEIKPSFLLEGEAEKRFFAMVRAIFQSRRKMLTNSLKSLGKPVDQIQRALEKTGISPQVRGEQLDLAKLVELAKALESA